MNAGELKARTKVFAQRFIRLCLALPDGYLGNHIKRQLLRCSTSVAANYRAACLAQSKGDFAAKLSIVIEEADELTAIFIASRKSIKDRSCEFTGS